MQGVFEWNTNIIIWDKFCRVFNTQVIALFIINVQRSTVENLINRALNKVYDLQSDFSTYLRGPLNLTYIRKNPVTVFYMEYVIKYRLYLISHFNLFPVRGRENLICDRTESRTNSIIVPNADVLANVIKCQIQNYNLHLPFKTMCMLEESYYS